MRNRSGIERVAQSVALVLPLTAVFAAVSAYGDSIPIDISFSAPVAPQPFTNPKDFFQLPAGARNVSLNITTFSVDDRGVLLLNDSIIGSTGIGGPGWGEMALTADGPSLPFNFQYGNNNAPFSVLNLFVTGWNELSLIVNNTGQGIFDGLSTLGWSSATVLGTVTFDVGSVPVPPPGPSAGPSPLPTFIITTSNFVPGLLIPGEPQISFTTVPGNLLFQPGVTYSVYLNATDTTYAVVSGTASLAGSVNAQFLPGSYTAKHSNIGRA